MYSPASLTHRYLYPFKAIWKLRCDCLTSLVIACCALWSAALLSASFQISWEIQDAPAFVGCSVIETYPLRYTKAAPPWSGDVTPLVVLANTSAPVGNNGYVSLPLPVSPLGLACSLCHGVYAIAPC